jgi:hypothetical protein
MKAWLANLMWDALRIFAGRVHDWAFDPQRHARIRMAHRERWWDYYCKAMRTKDKRDDMRAQAWAIEYKFETSPADAKARGDLD